MSKALPIMALVVCGLAGAAAANADTPGNQSGSTTAGNPPKASTEPPASTGASGSASTAAGPPGVTRATHGKAAAPAGKHAKPKPH